MTRKLVGHRVGTIAGIIKNEKRICIIGIEREPIMAIRKNYFGPTLYHEMLPHFMVNEGQLFIERTHGIGMLPVDIVVFYGGMMRFKQLQDSYVQVVNSWIHSQL